MDASLKVGLLEFDAAVELAARQTIAGDDEGAIRSYGAALSLYVGDLWVGSDVRQLPERERLRATYGLPPMVIPPFWHRHDELVWELSALHQHWLNSYDPWRVSLGAARVAPRRRRREEPAARVGLELGHPLDRDRPTRQTTRPGETPALPVAETLIVERDTDFVQFVLDDVTARRRIEERVRLRAS